MNMQRSNMGGSTRQYMPIAAVLPYRKDYAFKARLIERGELRSWSNDKGTGHLFTITFMDQNCDTMIGRFFTDAADKFGPILTVGKVFEFCEGKIQMPQRPSGTTSEYEVTFDVSSTINELQDDNTIPQYSLKKVATLDSIPTLQDVKAVRDYLAIVHSAKPLQSFTTKAGKQSYRRDIQLIDKSNLIVDVTFWGEQAQKYSDQLFDNNPVILLQAAVINEYMGSRSLQSSFNSTIVFNLRDSKSQTLTNWYKSASHSDFKSLRDLTKSGNTGEARRIYSRQRLIDIDEESLLESARNGSIDSAQFNEWLNFEGYIVRIQYSPPSGSGEQTQGGRRIWYEACPGTNESGRKCGKKVIWNGEHFICDSCRYSGDCERKYILSALIADESGSRFVSMFDEEGRALLGKSAAELYQIQQEQGEDVFSNLLNTYQSAPFHGTLRVHMENRDGQYAIRYRVFRVDSPPTYIRTCQNAIEEIKYLKQLDV